MLFGAPFLYFFSFSLGLFGDILLLITHETYGISIKTVGQGKDVSLCLQGSRGPLVANVGAAGVPEEGPAGLGGGPGAKDSGEVEGRWARAWEKD